MEILYQLGKIAGIGGISLGIFLFLFRDLIKRSIFPKLDTNQGYKVIKLFMFMTWSIALIGISAWVYAETQNKISAFVNIQQNDNYEYILHLIDFESKKSPYLVSSDPNLRIFYKSPPITVPIVQNTVKFQLDTLVLDSVRIELINVNNYQLKYNKTYLKSGTIEIFLTKSSIVSKLTNKKENIETKRISGRIINYNNIGIENIKVICANGNNFTYTNNEGFFELKVPKYNQSSIKVIFLQEKKEVWSENILIPKSDYLLKLKL